MVVTVKFRKLHISFVCLTTGGDKRNLNCTSASVLQPFDLKANTLTCKLYPTLYVENCSRHVVDPCRARKYSI